MQSTDVKTKSKIKKIVLTVICSVLSVCILFITFGQSLGVPGWNDIFAFFGIYADLGDDLSVSFVNVGTADACCIKCRGKNVLLDTGTKLSYDKLSAYVRRNDFKHFDAVIISHADSDHIGGLSDIIEEFGTDRIYMLDFSSLEKSENVEIQEVYNSVMENNVEIKEPKVNSSTYIGDMKFDFISPQKTYNDKNDNSLVVRLTYGKNSFLFTGDISKKVEKDLLNSDLELKSDVLKVAHHGSGTSSCEEFLKAVNPKISVVSVGKSNYRLPDYTTMSMINHYSDSLYRTDRDKTVVITSDGQNLSVKTHA